MPDKWIVIRTSHESNVFEGIEAESAEEALAKWYEGEGELNNERTTFPEWDMEARRA